MSMAIITIVTCEDIIGQQDRQIGEMSTITTTLIGVHFCIVDSIETRFHILMIKKPEHSRPDFHFIGSHRLIGENRLAITANNEPERLMHFLYKLIHRQQFGQVFMSATGQGGGLRHRLPAGPAPHRRHGWSRAAARRAWHRGFLLRPRS
jgi:hypothetical protein